MDGLSDPVKVDTSLAEEYIQKKDVVEEPEPGRAWDYDSKTYFNPNPRYDTWRTLNHWLDETLEKLSKKLEENTELFCQLEYLMRKIDVDETRDCHLQLISQYLRLEAGGPDRKILPLKIIMEESTPLFHLGHVATVLRNQNKPILVCKKTTAPQCQLFYELCLDVGLEIYFFGINNSDTLPRRHPVLTMGCTLAVTEEADMDSAVDVFLNSSAEAPWRIERIYVQESVYEQLLETLETRCTREASERCVDAFRTARGRGVECGVGAGAGGGVPVRAYRGARDLLALLPPAGALSLWCGAAAAAHELALAAPADLVWINHYAVFEGPPSASIPFYNCGRNIHYIPEKVYTRLLELHRKWIARPLDERKAVVLDVVEKIYGLLDDADDFEYRRKVAESMAVWTPVADQVDIAPDRITMVIDRYSHTDIHFIDYLKYIEASNNGVLELMKSTIRGYKCLIIHNNQDELISELYNAGVPATISEVSNDATPECSHKIILKSRHSDKKVIHSRFGTMYSI